MGAAAGGGIGWIDGEYRPRSALALPVSDLGFSLGDMCYDALHVRAGRFFRLEDHLDRFERACAARRYASLPLDRDGVRAVLAGCVRRAGLREAMVTFVATRGEPDGFTKDLRTCRNRFMAWAAPYYSLATDAQMRDGMHVAVSRVPRVAPESIDPTVKNFNRLDFVGALMDAYERGADHALLLDREGRVTEGRGWNLFALFGGTLVTPESGVLEGITRATVIEIGARTNLDVRVRALGAEELRSADELMMTSSAGGVMPITRLDGEPVADGHPGPVTGRIAEAYWALHDDPAYATPVDYDAEDESPGTAPSGSDAARA